MASSTQAWTRAAPVSTPQRPSASTQRQSANSCRLASGLASAPELAALEAKRAANVAAKDASSEIKLNFSGAVPEGYQKRLMAAQREAAARAPSAEEQVTLTHRLL